MIPPHLLMSLGGCMNARTVAAVAVLALVLAGCGSDDAEPEPPASSSAAASPTVDQEAARKACVDAWADLLRSRPEAGLQDEPSACAGLPEGERLDRYMEGLWQRNEENRARIGTSAP